MPDPLDVAAMRARCEAATPGLWHTEPDVNFGNEAEYRGSVVADEDIVGGHYLLRMEADGNAPEADAAFIAHAREDVPALLARVEALEGALREAGDVIHVATLPGRPSVDRYYRALARIAATLGGTDA